jgi:O-antigen ligase
VKPELARGTRWTLNKDTFHMALQRPILGWGLGTFPVVYPQFRTFYTNFYVNEAHNDYLQTLVETGRWAFSRPCGSSCSFAHSPS